MLGLDNRLAAFKLQRDINQYGAEPLLAIFPGVALQELWDLVRVGEQAHARSSRSSSQPRRWRVCWTVSLAGLNERRCAKWQCCARSAPAIATSWSCSSQRQRC